MEYNALSDCLVMAVLFAVTLAGCYFGCKADARKKAALRGATRIAH